jgi:hypothetical protein
VQCTSLSVPGTGRTVLLQSFWCVSGCELENGVLGSPCSVIEPGSLGPAWPGQDLLKDTPRATHDPPFGGQAVSLRHIALSLSKKPW